MEWLVILGLIFYLIHDRRRTDRLERELQELKQELAASRLRPNSGAEAASLSDDGPHRAAGDTGAPPLPVPQEKERAKKLSPSPIRAKNPNRQPLGLPRPVEKWAPPLLPAVPGPSGSS